VSDNNVKKLADDFGKLIAERDKLLAEISEIKKQLVEVGETVVGDKYTAIYVKGSTSMMLDKKAVEAEMGEAWVDAHSKIVNRSPSVKAKRLL
jgi:uncharacterized coiled-coil DUF342 family protein